MSKAADIVEQTIHAMVTYDAFPDSLAEERDEQPIRADHAGDPTADLDCWRIP